DSPGDPEQGLLVPDPDVPPSQLNDEFAELPQFPDIDELPAAGRPEDRQRLFVNRQGRRVRQSFPLRDRLDCGCKVHDSPVSPQLCLSDHMVTTLRATKLATLTSTNSRRSRPSRRAAVAGAAGSASLMYAADKPRSIYVGVTYPRDDEVIPITYPVTIPIRY